MGGAGEDVTIHWVSLRFSSSLSTWVLVNPPLIPSDSQLDTPAPSEWRAVLTVRDLSRRLLVKADWRLLACGENTALLLSLNLSLHYLYPFISPSSKSKPPLFSMSLTSTVVLPLFSLLFWQLNDEKDEEGNKKLPLLSGARMMSWGHLSSWCGGFPSPANYLVQTWIWYGGYEAQTQLLWANKEILRFREWGRDCKWDRRKHTCTAMHAHA